MISKIPFLKIVLPDETSHYSHGTSTGPLDLNWPGCHQLHCHGKAAFARWGGCFQSSGSRWGAGQCGSHDCCCIVPDDQRAAGAGADAVIGSGNCAKRSPQPLPPLADSRPRIAPCLCDSTTNQHNLSHQIPKLCIVHRAVRQTVRRHLHHCPLPRKTEGFGV